MSMSEFESRLDNDENHSIYFHQFISFRFRENNLYSDECYVKYVSVDGTICKNKLEIYLEKHTIDYYAARVAHIQCIFFN